MWREKERGRTHGEIELVVIKIDQSKTNVNYGTLFFTFQKMNATNMWNPVMLNVFLFSTRSKEFLCLF